MATEYARLHPAEQHALYERILSRCVPVKGEAVPVVVFDLDGTLMDNRPRTAVILKELALELEQEAHEAAAILHTTQAEQLAYLLTDSLRKLGIDNADVTSRAEAYWRTRFFSDHYLKHDVALNGAVDFAKACYERGATLVYFTGRDLPLMGIGSFQSLRDLGFPIGIVGTELVCKADAKIPDETFKRDESPKIRRIGKVIAAFDNEPGNCNVFREICPDADTVFVDTQHLPGAPPLFPGVHVVADFAMR